MHFMKKTNANFTQNQHIWLTGLGRKTLRKREKAELHHLLPVSFISHFPLFSSLFIRSFHRTFLILPFSKDHVCKSFLLTCQWHTRKHICTHIIYRFCLSQLLFLYAQPDLPKSRARSKWQSISTITPTTLTAAVSSNKQQQLHFNLHLCPLLFSLYFSHSLFIPFFFIPFFSSLDLLTKHA